MAVARAPSDVRYLEWPGKDGFGRVRAEWLQFHRWDSELSPATVVVLAEISGHMGHDRDWAWPSIPRLAANLGWSEPTVKRAVSQAIDRGWLIIERRGFGGSNHYAMAFSPSIQSWVQDEHERRIHNFIETRPPSLRSKMIRMEDDAIEINSDPSLRSKMIPHSDQKRSPIEINSDPLSLSLNLSNEPDHRSSTDRLGDREQDKPQGKPILPSESPVPSLLDDDEADEQLRVEEEALARIGQGDLVLGRRRAALLGPHRLSHLAQRILAVGMIEAAPDIFAAIEMARDLETRATLKAKAVTP